jgi:hypothetical protein
MDIERLVPNPHKTLGMNYNPLLFGKHEGFREARQLTFNAVVKWLWEPDMEHSLEIEPNDINMLQIEVTYKDGKFYYAHRFNSPLCMQSLKERVKQ